MFIIWKMECGRKKDGRIVDKSVKIIYVVYIHYNKGEINHENNPYSGTWKG